MMEYWQEHAACRGVDPDLFFPERGETNREAKRICLTCPVRVRCLDYALAEGEWLGIWGGMTPRDRRRERTRRRDQRRGAA